MKYRGIVYDVGLDFNNDGNLSVTSFDPQLVEHDLRVIANELHANAIRIEGEPIPHLVNATKIAHALDLKVFFNPWKMHATIEQTQEYVADAAQAAAQLKAEGVDVVFVTSCEYSIFSRGVFPGETFKERLAFLGAQFGTDAAALTELPQTLVDASAVLNDALRSFVEVVRTHFDGLVTYSAGTWEVVDWSIFDIVGVDHYRMSEPADKYVSALDRYRVGKPLAVMEFGCCAYEGAAVLGPAGFMALEEQKPDGTGVFKDGVVPVRSEREQADYVGTQLGLLADADVHAAFVYVFSFPCMRAGEGPKDLDMVTFSLVKTWPESDQRSEKMPPWERKEAFHRVAECFKRLAMASHDDSDH